MSRRQVTWRQVCWVKTNPAIISYDDDDDDDGDDDDDDDDDVI